MTTKKDRKNDYEKYEYVALKKEWIRKKYGMGSCEYELASESC